jgi:arylsulfatase A-like enzyme
VVIVLVARTISNGLYSVTERLFAAAVRTLSGGKWRLRTSSRELGGPNSLLEDGSQYQPILLFYDSDLESSSSETDEPLPYQVEKSITPTFISRWFARAKFLVPIGTVVVLLLVRPRHFPFGHMSNTLPFTLWEVFSKPTDEMCFGSLSGDFPPFPLPDVLAEINWEPANGAFPGWKPKVNRTFTKDLERPSWLPEEPTRGFERWYPDAIFDGPRGKHGKHGEHGHGGPPGGPPGGPGRRPPPPHHEGMFSEGINYDPITDPLRISNLDKDLIDSIAATLKEHKVSIKHVVLLSMESTRKDVFPFKKDSHLHISITESHTSNFSTAEVNRELGELTRNAEILTGEASGFGFGGFEYSAARAGSWRNLKKDNGGLNIQGALTGSTSSLKSILGSHCGVHPLPVDFTVEVRRTIYQPCLPSILSLFNHNKPEYKKYRPGPDGRKFPRTAMEDRPWRSVSVQSMTDQYDHQDRLYTHIGFQETIVRDTLLDPSAPHPPTEKEVNYFGFAETQIKPYLRDLFEAAESKNERLFLSHFTSTTHHPWAVPESFGESKDYVQRSRWHGEGALNKYLNTIKYQDNWIGQFMDLLEDVGVADETLVVMVGDHGWAFEEDAAFHGTFENGHIANLKVPLVFHHPSLPRLQLEINATSTSILPTILDLLSSTSSLNKQDTEIANNLVHQYEGQSLIRPFVPEKNGRRAWNVGVLNAGGAVLSVTSAGQKYHLVLPICKNGVYRLTNLVTDPTEYNAVEAYSIEELCKKILLNYRAPEAAQEWVKEAAKVGKWWALEQRRRWRFEGAALQEDQKSDEMEGMGKVTKKHWWET